MEEQNCSNRNSEASGGAFNLKDILKERSWGVTLSQQWSEHSSPLCILQTSEVILKSPNKLEKILNLKALSIHAYTYAHRFTYVCSVTLLLMSILELLLEFIFNSKKKKLFLKDIFKKSKPEERYKCLRRQQGCFSVPFTKFKLADGGQLSWLITMFYFDQMDRYWLFSGAAKLHSHTQGRWRTFIHLI